MKIIQNPNKEVYEMATKAVEDNKGYCPCSLIYDDTTKCMCLNFRSQEAPGPCECGRYIKTEI